MIKEIIQLILSAFGINVGNNNPSPSPTPTVDVKAEILSSVPMTKKDEFIKALHVVAEAGYDKGIVYAHAIEEVGWDFKDTAGDYNFWGITAHPDWTGKKVNIPTTEWKPCPKCNGVGCDYCKNLPAGQWMINAQGVYEIRYDTPRWFCDWDSADLAMQGYLDHIEWGYPECVTNKANYLLYFPGLVHGGWNENPEYSTEGISIYEKIKADGTLTKLG